MEVAQVWINNKEVSKHYGGYLPFAIDITNFLNKKNNVIAVLADNSDNKLLSSKEKSIRIRF